MRRTLGPRGTGRIQAKGGKRALCTSSQESCDQMLQSPLPEPASRGVPGRPPLWPPLRTGSPGCACTEACKAGGHLLMVLCAPFPHLTREKAQISQSLPCLLPTSVNRCGIKKIKAKDLHSQFNVITGMFLIEENRLMTCLKSQRGNQYIKCTSVYTYEQTQISLLFALLYFKDTAIFYKLKICGNPALSDDG